MKLVSIPVVTELKPYRVKELCTLYGISPKTLQRWLLPLKEEIGVRQGHVYNVYQVRIIFQKLGVPAIIEQYNGR